MPQNEANPENDPREQPGPGQADSDVETAEHDLPSDPAENPSGSVMVEPGDTVPSDEGVNPEDPYRVEPYQDDEEPYRYDYYEDGYAKPEEAEPPKEPAPAPASESAVAVSGGGRKPPKDPEPEEEEDPEEEGMLRMSFMEHLDELRTRLIRIVAGLGIAFAFSIFYAEKLWQIVSGPATKALTELGINPPNLTQITPMEAFNVVYIKLPLIAAVFLASPWILYQVWGFIAPGLYKRERKWAAPFVIGSAGLFITGGLFAYFVAFRFGLTFLLGIGRDINITPMVSITEYFDLFVNVVLAISLVFELPILIFFLTLLRIVNPGFLIRNSRYAILGIVILAAIITPTPDVFNLMIFSVPMIVLFFVGVLLSYLLVIHQEGRRFPWKVLWWTLAGLVLIGAGVLAIAIFSYGYHFQASWPFLVP
ncbi:MAG: twin-arginine translocase subunit TatC [Bryobacterales bacterium]|nr:twin-arginine translocase subunit TatC [Bryobacterales bacterium]